MNPIETNIPNRTNQQPQFLARLTQICSGWLFRLLGRLCYRLRVEGLEHIRATRLPVILIANHKSWIDHFIIIAALLKGRSETLPVHVLVADRIWRMPAVGLACRLLGAHPARYGSGVDVSLAPLFRHLGRGESVGLYPEGGMERCANAFGQPKVGAAYLAYHSGHPIVPLAIKGLEELTWRNFFFGGRTVTVKFGAPMWLTPRPGAAGETVIEEGRVQLMNQIIRLYRSIPSY